jgi:hypothetical protein
VLVAVLSDLSHINAVADVCGIFELPEYTVTNCCRILAEAQKSSSRQLCVPGFQIEIVSRCHTENKKGFLKGFKGFSNFSRGQNPTRFSGKSS